MLCAVINAVLLMSICFNSDRTKSIHRLLIYISVASQLALLVEIFQVESIGCDFIWHRPACEITGFFTQFAAWVLMLNVLWLVSLISLHYWCPNYRNILTPKKDILVWVGIIFVSLILSLLPIGTSAYGLNNAYCWIKSSRIAEQWALWYGWMFICGLVIVVMLGLALWYSETRIQVYYESSRAINNSKQEMCRGEAKKIKALIFCILVYLTVTITMVIIYQVLAINRSMPLLILIGITEPMSILAVPLIFLTHLHNNKNVIQTKKTKTEKCRPTTGNHERSVRSLSGSYCSSNGHKKGNVIGSGEDFTGDITESLLVTEAERSELGSTM